MKFLLFVTLIWTSLAFSQSLNWSPKWIQIFNNKTAFEMCKAASLNVKHACVEFQLTPQKTSKFQFKLEADRSLIVSYKGYSTRLERTDDPQIFKINRKKLSIEDSRNAKALREAIIKRLPSPKALLNLWISLAHASSSFPHTELGSAITIMMMSQQEQDICQNAVRIIKSCETFNAEFVDKMKNLKLEKPNELEELKKHQLELRNARMIFSQSNHFHMLLSNLGIAKTNWINKCSCENGICKIHEKDTELGASFEVCKANMGSLHEIAKNHKDLDQHISDLTDLILDMEAQKSETSDPKKEASRIQKKSSR